MLFWLKPPHLIILPKCTKDGQVIFEVKGQADKDNKTDLQETESNPLAACD